MSGHYPAPPGQPAAWEQLVALALALLLAGAAVAVAWLMAAGA